MFGIMGNSAAFAQAAGRTNKKNTTILRFSEDNPEIILSCTGNIRIKSTSGGKTVIEEYSDLDTSSVSITADANTDVTIVGDVTVLKIDETSVNYYKSNNKVLTLLRTENTQLNSLDVSKNMALQVLWLNEMIKTIDLSQNVALVELHSAGLTSIDISKNVNLEGLDLENAPIVTLDASKNTALKSISVNTGNTLTSIILPESEITTYINVSEQYHLTSIDVSKNVNLEVLSCNSTGLTSIDLSKNTALTELYCDNCAELISISYPATNSDVSTEVARAITAADSTTGTVYTDSAGAYYSTIETAATTKGWTIEQIA